MHDKKFSIGAIILVIFFMVFQCVLYINSPIASLGISFEEKNSSLIVSYVNPFSASYEQNLRSGMKILKIDNIKLTEDNFKYAVSEYLPNYLQFGKDYVFSTENGMTVSGNLVKLTLLQRIRNIPIEIFSLSCLLIIAILISFLLVVMDVAKNYHFIPSLILLLLASIVLFSVNTIGLSTGYKQVYNFLGDTVTLLFCSVLLYSAYAFYTSIGFNKIRLIFLFVAIFCVATFVTKYILLVQNTITWNNSIFSYFNILFIGLTIILYSICFFHIAVEKLSSNTFFNSKNNELSNALKSEVDALERTLQVISDHKNLYTTLVKWVLEHFKSRFVAVIAIEMSNRTNVAYYEECKPSHDLLITVLDELRFSEKYPVRVTVIKDCVYIPFYKKNSIDGFLILGPKDKKEVYTAEQQMYFGPIGRILSKAMLNLEAGRMSLERNQLQSAFSRYVSPDVVDQIIENPEIMHLGGKKQILSVIFTDLEGFTEMSDEMDPVLLVRVLNLYLNEMSEVIIALGGTIDKFEGDAIMAFFGAPSPMKYHAIRCCQAALRMQKMEKIINDQLLNEKLIKKPLRTRIGINSGDMVVGNVGSLKRIDYTIIGGNVNIAARIENANKEFGTSVLISDQTYELVKDYFELELVDTVHLRGVRRPVKVYKLLNEKECIAELDSEINVINDAINDNIELEVLEEV